MLLLQTRQQTNLKFLVKKFNSFKNFRDGWMIYKPVSSIKYFNMRKGLFNRPKSDREVDCQILTFVSRCIMLIIGAIYCESYRNLNSKILWIKVPF